MEGGIWNSRVRFESSAELVGEIAPEEREALMLRMEKLLAALPPQWGATGIGLERARTVRNVRKVYYSMTGVEGGISVELDETPEGLMRLQFDCFEVHSAASTSVSSEPEVGPIR